MHDTVKWRGIGASPGCAAGKAWRFESKGRSWTDSGVRLPLDAGSEVQRLRQAVDTVDEKLLKLEDKVRSDQGGEVAQIFTAHRMLLRDDGFFGEACDRIMRMPQLPAEQAITQVAEEIKMTFDQLEDEYFRERSADINDILQQILQALGGNTELAGGVLFPAEGSYIVIAEELTPAQTVNLPKERVLGFIVRKGGKTSHAAILARTYGLPAVITDMLTWEELKSFPAVRIDGDEGWVERLTLEQLKTVADPAAVCSRLSDDDAVLPSEFAGLVLAANIGGPVDLYFANKFQAQGVGLFRTEFLFMGECLPGEDEQMEAYREVIAACKPNVTVIRTLDIGGDKQAPALNLPREQNPFLGMRAIRFCLQQPEIFLTQLRALWRAAAAGPTAVMFPMIATVEELRLAKQYLHQARAAVIRDGYPAGDIQVGIMIEVPSAALIACQLAKEVDFFSIGTNDLTQYTMAADRENSSVAGLGQHYHPAVLTLIAQATAAAKENGIWVGICGEAGGDALLTPFFIALGIDELSMAPGQLPQIRRKLFEMALTREQRDTIVQEVLECATAEEVKKLLGGGGVTER